MASIIDKAKILVGIGGGGGRESPVEGGWDGTGRIAVGVGTIIVNNSDLAIDVALGNVV